MYSMKIVKPLEKLFSAIHVKTKFVFNFRWKNDSSSEKNIPANIAHKRPSQQLCVYALPITPINAANSIAPSILMFVTPARSETSADMVASRIGVVSLSTEYRNEDVIIMLKIVTMFAHIVEKKLPVIA